MLIFIYHMTNVRPRLPAPLPFSGHVNWWCYHEQAYGSHKAAIVSVFSRFLYASHKRPVSNWTGSYFKTHEKDPVILKNKLSGVNFICVCTNKVRERWKQTNKHTNTWKQSNWVAWLRGRSAIFPWNGKLYIQFKERLFPSNCEETMKILIVINCC